MTERWDRQVDRKLAPAKHYVAIVPVWIRLLAVFGPAGLAVYLAIEDRQPFRAVWLFFSSYQLGFLVTWVLLMLPCAVAVVGLAALLHRRRREQDFPSARVHR